MVEPALAAEALFQASTLGIMHGSSFTGNGNQARYDLATEYEQLIATHCR